MATPRRRLIVAGSILLGSLLAACFSGDASNPAGPRIAGPAMAKGSDTSTSVISINPAYSITYNLSNGHKLWVRAYGVCALSSSYGPGTWDETCAPARTATKVTVKMWDDADGHPHLDFSPALRFVPSATGSTAELYLHDKAAAGDVTSRVLYCSTPSSCVDEALTDPTLLSVQDNNSGFVWRRIKHFSGYEVAVGRSDTTVTTDAGY